MGGGVVFQRVISGPTEKTTGALAALMFKLPIQLFPMKLRLDPLLVKLHLNLSPSLVRSLSCVSGLSGFSCPSRSCVRLVSATTLTKD